jgi:ubiquinone/menaquinone biosynthesis C-methylase UbiE
MQEHKDKAKRRHAEITNSKNAIPYIHKVIYKNGYTYEDIKKIIRSFLTEWQSKKITEKFHWNI